jgi:hypothetical protein
MQPVKVNGRMVEVNTQSVSRGSDSQGGQTAKRAGAGAVVGVGLAPRPALPSAERPARARR